jgi:UDP-glucuronate 4-epimerase
MNGSILVTGAAGFIGSHLCEALLNRRYRVVGIDHFDPFLSHPDFLLLEGDAGDCSVLDRIPYSVDVVIHLAAKAGVWSSLKSPGTYIRSNTELTNHLLEWMRLTGIRKIVFASSSPVYGNNAKNPVEESDGMDEPISPYAFTKRSCN